MNPEFQIADATVEALTRIERARGFLEAATLSEEWVQAMGRRTFIREAHHTTYDIGWSD